MKRILTIAVISMLVFTAISAAGCTSTDKIGDIMANPIQYEGKDVSVKGYVGNTIWVSLLSKGAYEIGDGSGTIWVVTSQPPPQEGVEISAKGKVSTAFKLGDRTLGTIITESKRS